MFAFYLSATSICISDHFVLPFSNCHCYITLILKIIIISKEIIVFPKTVAALRAISKYSVECTEERRLIRLFSWFCNLKDIVQGVTIPYSPPPPPKLKVAQYNQTYCRKAKSISAMDFQCFHFVSIFTIFSILSNKNAQIKKIT